MLTYTPYRDDLETIAFDEAETHAKIIEVMTDGQRITREKYGTSVRISHAKAHGLLKSELIVRDDLPPELAQGLFVQPGSHPVVVRLALAPGEYTDDSKVSTERGMSIKVFNVEDAKLPPFEDITNQDFVFDTTKQFFVAGVKAFLQAFKPNAEIATKLSDTTKGIVSDVSFDPQTPDALREATVKFFRYTAAEFDFVGQLNTDLDQMSIEDAQAAWSEEESPYRPVARLRIPVQNAFDPVRADIVDGNFSFSPAHTPVAHCPLGGINRARLVAYTAMATLRRRENNRPTDEPAGIDSVPA